MATDPDREGEAISWHLKELLELPDDKTSRVTFNEITKKVVTESIAAPREIDQNLVDAQQARRVLDRIVGYELSPLLWKKIRRAIRRPGPVGGHPSGGRAGGEIGPLSPRYWTLEVTLDRIAPNQGSFKTQFWPGKAGAQVPGAGGGGPGRHQDAPFSVSRIKRQDKNRSPAPPFITSTLQQEASRKLNMSPGGPCPSPSSCMRAWTSRGRGRWVSSPT
ncbi:MAG: toprim domain-containing protein [Evtepia gabavorous]